MKKDFTICLLILAAVYSCGTLLYYSQTFLLYNYYDNNVINEMLSGWAYISQALGIALFSLLYKFKSGLSGRRIFQVTLSILLIPIICISVFIKNGPLLIAMMFLLNIIIGAQTAFAFSLIAAYVSQKHFALCFAFAYSIGGVITFLISLISTDIMISYKVIFFACIFIGIAIGLIQTYKDACVTDTLSNTSGLNTNDADALPEDHNGRSIFSLCVIIVLMAVITALGSNDPYLVASGSQISFLSTRLFYAAGLIIAAFLFDYNHVLGGICALASILYPIIVIMLYTELPMSPFLIGLTDTLAAFYVVYRAGMFISLASNTKKLHHAAFGLAFSRIVEGIMVITTLMLGFKRLTSFIVAGVMFIPLIIVFCWSLVKQKSPADTAAAAPAEPIEVEERPSFAELYKLTRRESEIAYYLSENKTNGEIAELLCVSESTVRFHVSNILKKTGMANRTEVGRHYYG